MKLMNPWLTRWQPVYGGHVWGYPSTGEPVCAKCGQEYYDTKTGTTGRCPCWKMRLHRQKEDREP